MGRTRKQERTGKFEKKHYEHIRDALLIRVNSGEKKGKESEWGETKKLKEWQVH